MDSARDFYLLGESVPQVRVLAHTLALLGFFQLVIYIYNIYILALMSTLPETTVLLLAFVLRSFC